MKKNILSTNLILLAFAVTLIFLSSCEDFLTEINPNRQTTESFWKTLDEADQGLTAVYNRFKDQHIYGVNMNNWSDLTFPGFGLKVNTTNELYLGTFTNSTKQVADIWAALYNGIFRANQVIEGIKSVKHTNSVADQNREKYILGQAYFFRGLFLFYLYNTYNNGNVPIKDVNNMYDMYTTISPAADVRAFYLNDLDSAYSKLPDNWRATPKDQGRVTKGAVATVLGQSYLYEKDYAKAATYFQDVINNPNYGKTNGYRLVPNIGDNFNVAGELNEESILEVCYSNKYLQDKTGGNDWSVSTSFARNIAAAPAGGWRAILPAAWLELAFREDVLDYSDPRNQYPDGSFRTYSQRLAKSISCLQDTSSITYGKKQYLLFSYVSRETSYFKKFTNWETPGVEMEDKMLSRSSINFRVLRLADVYLMYAECLIKGGTNDAGVTEALIYVNRVRQRSALQLLGASGSGEFPTADHDNISYTAQTLMDFIKWKERPMELCLEGYAMRHIDMRRWGEVKERFTSLSQQYYYFDLFKFIDPNTQKTVTRWNSILLRVEDASILPDNTIDEFVHVAKEYSPAWDYFPIPSLEETANPTIYK